MLSRSSSYIGRFGYRTSTIAQVVQPKLGLGPGPSAFVSVESAGQRCVAQARIWDCLPTMAKPRQFCSSSKDVEKGKEGSRVAESKEKSSILEDFHLRAKRPTKVDRWILVFMGRYKSDEEIPDFVSNTIINSTKNKFRIIVNIGMCVFALVGGIVMIYIGRKRMHAGESIAGMNMERRKDYFDRTTAQIAANEKDQ